MDPVARFIEECCHLGTHLWAASAALRQDYEEWCREQGETPVSGDTFSRKLRALGCEPHKHNRRGGRGWKGIGIRGEHLATVEERER